MRESAEDAVARALGLAANSDFPAKVQAATEATKQAAGQTAGNVSSAVKSGADSAKGLLVTGVEKARVAVGTAEKTAEKAKESAKSGAAAALSNRGDSEVQKALEPAVYQERYHEQERQGSSRRAVQAD